MSGRKRTSQRTLCSMVVMEAARQRVEGGESKRSVAKSLGMAESTLRKRLKRTTVATKLGRYDITLTPEMEEELSNYIKTIDNMFYGLTSRALRSLAFEFAEKNKLEHRFDKTSKMAGKGWLRGFLKRHKDVTLRQPTATSLARAVGFNEPQCKRFYDNLCQLIKKYKFPPHAVYNMDESGFSTVPNKPPKVFSTKGKRCVNKISSAERGTNVSVVCAMSASGQYIPPAFIYPRKRMKAELLDGAPPSSVGMVSDSSFINQELFVDYATHFRDHAKPTKEQPVLLIMDNHTSHCSIAAIDFFRQNNIMALTLPPHSSHRMQPLDRCFFSPLKKFYSNECEKWLTNHPGRVITVFQIASIFATAYFKAATITNAVEGFKVTGICPYNNDIFTEADFMATYVTERENPATATVATGVEAPVIQLEVADNHTSETDTQAHQIPESSTSGNAPNIPDRPTAVLENSTTENMKTIHANERDAIISVAPTSEPESMTMLLQTKSNVTQPTEMVSNTSSITSTLQAKVAVTPETTKFDLINTPGTSSKYIKLTTISPLPKSLAARSTNRKSKKSEIITSSPYKDQLIEEEKKNPKRKPKLNMGDNIPPPQALLRGNLKRKSDMNLGQAKTSAKRGKAVLKKPRSSSHKKMWSCPGCKEIFKEPVTEDWIECISCAEWWHEKCSAYTGFGSYICDLCA